MSFNNGILHRLPPVTLNLLIINVLVFVFMALIPASKEMLFFNYCGLHYVQSPGFNPAQILTYMFIHSGFTHLFFNMFALFMFGPVIEWSVGSRRFLFYYICCGVGAALIQEAVYAVMVQKYIGMLSADDFHLVVSEGWKAMKQGLNFSDPTLGSLNALVNSPTVGASGAIYGVLLAFGMLYPNRPIYLMFIPVPIAAKWMVIGYGVLELLMGVTNTASNVAHFAHLGGMVFGIFIILYWKRKGIVHGDRF